MFRVPSNRNKVFTGESAGRCLNHSSASSGLAFSPSDGLDWETLALDYTVGNTVTSVGSL